MAGLWESVPACAGGGEERLDPIPNQCSFTVTLYRCDGLLRIRRSSNRERDSPAVEDDRSHRELPGC